MRKLIESTFTTLDGVIEDPHVWGSPYWDKEHDAYAESLTNGVGALLLGRETYEGFKEAWGVQTGDPTADLFNALPKHVASRTLTEATWNAEIIQGDVAEAVAELKAQDGGHLLKYGTGEFDKVLGEHKLVDEYHFWIFPVFAGRGERLFDGFDTTHLELLGTTIFDSGIVVHKYGPK